MPQWGRIHALVVPLALFLTEAGQGAANAGAQHQANIDRAKGATGAGDAANADPQRLRVEGQLLFDQRDYDGALAAFKKLVKLEPKKQINWHKKAITYTVKNLYKAALRDWSKAIALDKNFVAGYLWRGKTHLKLGLCDEALTDFKMVKQLAPNEVTPNLKDVERCIHHKTRGLMLATPKTCPNGGVGNRCKAGQSNCPAALEHLGIAIGLAPYGVDINMAAARCKYIARDFNEALKYSGNALRGDPQNLDVLKLRGDAYYYMAEHKLAKTHFASGLKIDPENKTLKTAFRNIKKIMRIQTRVEDNYNKRKWKDALEDINDLMDADVEHVNLIKKFLKKKCDILGQMMKRKQRIPQRENAAGKLVNEDRLGVCNMAVNYAPKDAEAYVFRGQAQLDVADDDHDKLDAALRDFEKAAQLDPQNRKWRKSLNDAKFQIKKKKRRDYYKILDLGQKGKFASVKDIKRAFRKCGTKWHPDRTTNTDEKDAYTKKFQLCAEANDILGDPEKKKRYDAGHDVLGESQGGNRQNFNRGGPFGGQRFTFRFN